MITKVCSMFEFFLAIMAFISPVFFGYLLNLIIQMQNNELQKAVKCHPMVMLTVMLRYKSYDEVKW